MLLRRSRFVHLIPVGEAGTLVVHAMSHLRFVVDSTVVSVVDYFDVTRRMPDDLSALVERIGAEQSVIVSCIASLMERDVLTQKDAETELADLTARLSPTHGRDPATLLQRYRREL